ncbi:hypothetical protein FQA39_LY17997 [Lamprigera yunnana]|nr:hypothetical protein FQA39_LY17997 [Lamprigera yunnana]
MNKRKVVHSQGRQIIYNVYQFMKEEKEEGLTPLSQLQERVAEATGFINYIYMDIDSKEGVLIKSEVGVEETEDSLLEHEYYGIEELKSEPTDFRDHISVHPQEEPFSCIFCKLKFEDEDNLEQHMKTHITVIHPYICNECKFKTTEKDSLIEHLKIHRRIQYRKGLRMPKQNILPRTTTWQSWDENNMKNAVEEVVVGQMGYFKASKKETNFGYAFNCQ